MSFGESPVGWLDVAGCDCCMSLFFGIRTKYYGSSCVIKATFKN